LTKLKNDINNEPDKARRDRLLEANKSLILNEDLVKECMNAIKDIREFEKEITADTEMGLSGDQKANEIAKKYKELNAFLEWAYKKI